MPNKTKMQVQYALAETVIFAAVLQKDDVIRVTANNTVNQAAAGHVPRGYVVKSPTAANGNGTVMLKGRRVVQIKCSALVAANDELKMGALSGSDQQVLPWVQGTDNENLKVGWALVGAAANGTVTMVEY